jgi:hypothetical protein
MLYVYWENVIFSSVKPIDSIAKIAFEKKGDKFPYYEVKFGHTPLIFQIYKNSRKEIPRNTEDYCFYDELYILFGLRRSEGCKITYDWIEQNFKPNEIVPIDIFLEKLPPKKSVNGERLKDLRTYHTDLDY